jgi:hypothetical protein
MKYDLSKLPAKTREQILSSPKWIKLFSAFPTKLLGVGGDAKTVKGEKFGFVTAILYLTPAKGSGVQLCPLADRAKCAEACLNTAGRGAMSNVQMARLRKTLFFLQYRELFMPMLIKEIGNLSRRYGSKLLVRLNGTSDVRWENFGIVQAFPDVQFYDYTKIPNRVLPANYDQTFSGSGVPEYQPIMFKAINRGLRVAMVFRTEDSIPSTYAGLDVVSGDNSDIRHLDPSGVIVALYAKGKAKTDTSGFVV